MELNLTLGIPTSDYVIWSLPLVGTELCAVLLTTFHANPDVTYQVLVIH